MKPRKTRIKVLTLQDNTKEYIPQHKGLVFWYYFSDWDGASCLTHTSPYSYQQHDKSLRSAQFQIDKYIEAFAKEETRRTNSRVKNVDYVEYP